MLDTLRRPVATAPAPSPSVRFELTVTASPDALHRIVRVASCTPYTLLTLWLGAPRAGRRRLTMSVGAGGEGAGFEALRKRLDRVVDVVKIRVVS